MANCSLFGINVFINIIKRRCDNRKKKKTIEKKEKRQKKIDVIETDGTGSGRYCRNEYIKKIKKEEDF